jgi:hypothetical protein
MNVHTRSEDGLELRELSVEELDAVAGGWPKWLERLFGGGGGTGTKTPGQMTEETKKSWPTGSHWTDHN